MVTKKIFQIGSNPIRSRSKGVKDVQSKKTQRIIQDLVDTMRDQNLVGMAAPQIGEQVRIFVSEVRKTTYRRNSKRDTLRVFINPSIKKYSKRKVDGYEGCGSVGASTLFGPVKRSEMIIVQALDSRGQLFELKALGLLARIIQHEIDHLNGIVFLNRVKDTRKLLGKEEYIKHMKYSLKSQIKKHRIS